jgi:cytochrome c biogenesis protein CcmG/thiol:disulfide interchange protein DsbE
MGRNMRSVAWVLVALLIAGCAQSTHTSQSAVPAKAKIGAEAPAFDEPTASGSTLTMSSLEGKPVYLNFFASWCPPCNEEAPDVNAVQAQFKSRGLQVVGVDVLENAQKARMFLTEHHLTYPAIVDTGALRDAYDINGMPVHVFINAAGVVKKIEIGELSKTQMIADVRSIL